MKSCNETITIAQYHCIPILIYTNKCSILMAYGIDDNKHMFKTFYFLPIEENSHCFVFQLLIPVPFYEHTFFKQTNATITIDKDCIVGTHLLSDATIAKNIIIHEMFDDCIIGEYRIAKGYKDTIIWHSNTNNYAGRAKVEYKNGNESSLAIITTNIDNQHKKYHLSKNECLTIDLNNVRSLKIAKKNVDSQASGQYSIKVHGVITNQFKL